MATSPSPGFASSACPNCGSSSTVRIFRRDTTREWYLARCNACKQHYTDPQPTLDDIVSFYGDGYHEELLTVEHTRAAFGPKFESYINWIAPHLRPGGRTLDIGCSTGLFPCLLKERGFAAEGLELNSTTAKFARDQFGIPVTSQPFETAEYTPASFSLVSMTDVLEHSLSPIATLERVHGILEDGGHALITFPDISSVESHYFHTRRAPDRPRLAVAELPCSSAHMGVHASHGRGALSPYGISSCGVPTQPCGSGGEARSAAQHALPAFANAHSAAAVATAGNTTGVSDPKAVTGTSERPRQVPRPFRLCS